MIRLNVGLVIQRAKTNENEEHRERNSRERGKKPERNNNAELIRE